MASTKQRQLAVLALLGAVLLYVFVFRGDPTDGGAPAATGGAPSNPVSGTAGRQQPAAQMPVADVKLELLKAQREEAAAAQRNPFRFHEPPPPPPEPAPPPRAAAVAPPVPQGPPPPPPIPLRLIGMLNAPTSAGRVAVFSDGRGNTFNGREGDIIEGRYRLLKIGADSAELAYTDGRGRQVIRLSGQ
jgi:hypothetical protein